MLLRRLITLIKRNRAAAGLGVKFGRSASFSLPDKIMLGGKMYSLALPEENGVKVAFIDLLLDDCYGCRDVRAPVKTVLDVGANVGLFGLAARAAFPNAIIHCYEPNPNLGAYLESQSVPGRYEYFLEAVGLERGRVSLEYNVDSVQTRSTPNVYGEVNQAAFRDVISRLGGHVDMLKLDCEGAEWDLFRDAESWKNISRVSMEYHLQGQHTIAEVIGAIESLGLRINRHVPSDGFGLILASR
ncbi:MAG: hypothetical protein A2049_04720 [Elusimicrobia bacterium GWA2_62_23]|nr:MAG: hypothetical protein A2049_04720 [Elusimicrobia bacterium GWA2_62_23]